MNSFFNGCSSSSSRANKTFHADLVDEIHVLAVDDNIVDRKLIERLLKNSSCIVTTAKDGMSALEYLGLGDGQPKSSKRLKVNLIITDYCMPGMTGYELLKIIKGSSLTREIPVVVVSSEYIPTRVNQCLQEGAHMFMQQPLKQSDVKQPVAALLTPKPMFTHRAT